MAVTLKSLFDPNQVDNAAEEVILTVDSTPTNVILVNAKARFTNTTAGAVTIDAWAYPSGDAAADDTAILKGYSIPANDYIDIDIPVLAASGVFSAQAGAATSITCHCLGGTLIS